MSCKYRAALSPDAANSMAITTIWYLAATSGVTPERICPVIIPGSATRPTANMELITGIIPA